jgi:putative addiction module killer protein
MNTIVRTFIFDSWLSKLKDARGKARIIERIRTAERGSFGDCKSVGSGVFEMRIHFGPGYRVYFARDKAATYVLLCGGTKGRQQRAIQKARELVQLLNEE